MAGAAADASNIAFWQEFSSRARRYTQPTTNGGLSDQAMLA
jgi:hypothetical protein